MRKRIKAAVLVPAVAFLALCFLFLHQFRNRSWPSGQALPFSTSKFVVGVNYPWVNYGGDFGESFWGYYGVSTPATAQIVEQDFSQLQKQNIKMVRWFLWADGHGGIHFHPDGTVSGLDAHFFADVDKALEIARRHDIRIIFSLVDFKFFEGESYGTNGHNWGAHDLLVTSSAARNSFLERAVRPLVERYAGDETIAAWEIANEPEWEIGTSIRWGRKQFSPGQMQDFVAAVAACIHRYGHQPVTLGSLSPGLLPLWRNVGLDFYQVHSYPYTEMLDPLPSATFIMQLNKPCLLGEFPTKGALRPVQSYLDIAYKDGYAGAFAWSFRAQDNFSDYQSVRGKIEHWQKRH